MDKRGVSNNTLAMLIVLAMVISLGGTWYSLSRLQVLGFRVITGAQTGTVTTAVTNVTAITIHQSPVAFGNLAASQKNDTTDNQPIPFSINNTGNVPINVTTNATALFTGGSRNASSYRFQCNVDEGPNCPVGSATAVTDMPTANDTGLNRTAIFDLQDESNNDSREVDIFLSIASDELGGSKTSTVTFTATQI
ncbi:hypothetical protein HYS48_01740 [Candidatus Woesearchaeota archaeon]|nr:hypothetical protein [Candidatus Woesearchaeota archaeon]